MTQRTLTTPRGTLTYQLERKQVKNINLRVRPDGTISVSANPRVPLATLDDFVQRKADFVFNALEQFQQRAPLTPLTPGWKTGEKVLYLGEDLVLAVIEGTAKLPWHSDGTLFVVTEDLTDQGKIQRQIETFFKQKEQELFASLMMKYQQLLAGYPIPHAILKIRSMTSRWGSCHPRKGVVTLNSKLIHTPIACVDYVVLHEFCHFVHPNHSKSFYGLVAQFMPDWKERKELLQGYSARI